MKAKLNNSLLMEHYNLETEGQCLFVQKWSEMFFFKTINTYQFRLRNAHTILIETKQVLTMVKEQLISPSNLKDLIQECKKHLERDLCLRMYYTDLLPTLIKGLKVSSNFAENKSDILQLEYRLNNALQIISSTYSNNLIAQLEKSIAQNHQEEIEHFSELLASELVYFGWAPRSLSRLVNLHFLPRFNKTSTFNEKWNQFISAITQSTGIFHCYFKLDNSEQEYITSLIASDITVVSGEEILRTFAGINTLIQEDSKYIMERTEAFKDDLHTAVENCLYQLSTKQSVLSYFNIDLENFINTLVVFPNEDKITNYSIEQETNLEVEPNDENIQSVFNLLRRELFQPEDKRRLINFFRQYDLSINAISIETTYSNLWSSVESLLVTGHYGSNIEHIKKIIPSIMCTRYVQRLLKNFLEDCYRANLIPVFDGTPISKDDRNSIKSLFIIFNYEEELFNSYLETLNDYSLLKQRAVEIYKILANSQTLRDLMNNHYNTITWQVQRLYRVRNNLVHSASAEKDINLLIDHLHFYIRSTIHELLFRLESNEFKSLGDLFLAIEDNYYTLMEILKKNISYSPKGKIKKYDPDLVFKGPIFGFTN